MPANSRPTAAQTAILALTLLCLFFLSLLAYTFFHEAGHALAGLLFGGRLTSFDVNFITFSAHAGVSGNFSPLQSSLISLAGVGLPFLLFALLLAPRPHQPAALYILFRLLLSMGAINALLAWVALPLLSLAGVSSLADDSLNFLRTSGLHPVLLSAAALLLYLAGWALLLRPGGWRGLWADLQAARPDFSQPAERRTLLALAALGLFCGANSALLGWGLGGRALDGPPGYALAASFDLSQRAYADEIVYELDLEQPAEVSFYIALADVRGAPLEIRLSGPDGYDNLFFAASDPTFRAGQASVNPTHLPLAPGKYHLRFTFPQGSGRLRVYTLIEQ